MSLDKRYCPKCHNELDAQRVERGVFICSVCGYSPSAQKTADKKTTRDLIAMFVALSILAFGGFVHLINWNAHAVAIVPLKIKQWTGTASANELKQIVSICKHQSKAYCVLKAQHQLIKQQPNNVKALGEYARSLYQMKQDTQALKVFSLYFNKGGKSVKSMYEFAQTLKRNNQLVMAKEYYERALSSKPDVVQVTVTKAYVDLLLKMPDLKGAYALIKKTRQGGAHMAHFMEAEFHEIKQKL